MLYMLIATWEPAQRDAVVKRFGTLGPKVPGGGKVLGLWTDVSRGRTFSLEDWPPVADAKIIFEAHFPYTDLVNFECVPVMETEEVMKLIPKG